VHEHQEKNYREDYREGGQVLAEPVRGHQAKRNEFAPGVESSSIQVSGTDDKQTQVSECSVCLRRTSFLIFFIPYSSHRGRLTSKVQLLLGQLI
jgi:hypothetical protein